MKKILILMLAITLCLIAVGCKNNESEKNNDVNNEVIQNGTNIEDEEPESGDDSLLSYESTEDTFTVNFNNQYDMVFVFKDNVVSSYYTEYEFDTEDVAILFESEYIKDENVISTEVDGKIVRINLNPASYAGLSRANIEQMFSYLK